MRIFYHFKQIVKQRRSSQKESWSLFFQVKDFIIIMIKKKIQKIGTHFALKKLITNQKILVIGSGPSSLELKNVPEDIKIFTCKRGLGLFFKNKTLKKEIDLYTWQESFFHKYDIKKKISKFKIKLFLLNSLALTHFLRKQKKRKSEQSQKNFKIYYDSLLDNNLLISPYTFEDIRGNCIADATSLGMRLIKYALHYGPKEIYLIGIDFGKNGYFFGEKKRAMAS
jgi:hypothetical protein